MTLRAIPATLMRGGTSKGLYFHQQDLPTDTATRDRVLLAAMGSPDVRQIDGVGGAHPLTSKVAILSPSARSDADVDYLFLQVSVDRADVSAAQNCGNILAGVGPWAIENALVDPVGPVTQVRIHMVNTGAFAVASVPTPGGQVDYTGTAQIDGVPGTAAPISLDFLNIAGATCGALLPTGNVIDTMNGVEVTCVDNGMPVVLLRAVDFGLTGQEPPPQLEANDALKRRIEAIRLSLGPRMQLGDVSRKTVPKMTLISPPIAGGAVSTRSFIPHRVHEAIGVLGAVSVATACVLPGSVTQGIAHVGVQPLKIEHPTGCFSIELEFDASASPFHVQRSALIRTARKLMAGAVYVPASAWPAP
ncbi:MAG: 4-oxalomesaconate tautomerase [Pseudomonadota bacterium]